MSRYQYLGIFSYEHPGDKDALEKEKNKRLARHDTIKFPLVINPIDKRAKKEGLPSSNTLELFFVPIPDYKSLLNQIRKNSSEIKSLIDKLPGIVWKNFFKKMLISEMKKTNEIENVQTTVEEIEKAIEKADEKKAYKEKEVRLKSFAYMYLSIMKGDTPRIEKLEDIRSLYDSLLEGEIAKDKLPDGKLFRNGRVRIGTDTKTVLYPKTEEEDINKQLESWIEFINNDSIDPILKACVAHYYFEYVHPFYDGNGRLGRYIFCSYIGKKLDPFTAVSFSYQVNLKKGEYLREFEEVENAKNYGEITFFVIRLLKFLVSGQKLVLEIFRLYNKTLDFIAFTLEKWDISEEEASILFIYSQAKLFQFDDGSMEDRVLYGVLNMGSKYDKEGTSKSEFSISHRKMSKCLKKIEAEGMIETVKPKRRKLTEKFFKEIGLDIKEIDLDIK